MKQKFITFLFLFAIDQVTKILARIAFISPKGVLPFFKLQLAENTGIAFSLPFPSLPLIILSAVVLGILVWMLGYSKTLKKWEVVAFLFIFSGAMGNFLDRIIFGAVTDFLSFWNFPIFNFADVWISAGIVMYLWSQIVERKKK